MENEVNVVLRSVNRMKDVITLTRKCREDKKLGNSMPFEKIIILHDDPEYFSDIDNNTYYIREDGNVKAVE